MIADAEGDVDHVVVALKPNRLKLLRGGVSGKFSLYRLASMPTQFVTGSPEGILEIGFLDGHLDAEDLVGCGS